MYVCVKSSQVKFYLHSPVSQITKLPQGVLFRVPFVLKPSNQIWEKILRKNPFNLNKNNRGILRTDRHAIDAVSTAHSNIVDLQYRQSG